MSTLLSPEFFVLLSWSGAVESWQAKCFANFKGAQGLGLASVRLRVCQRRPTTDNRDDNDDDGNNNNQSQNDKKNNLSKAQTTRV